VTQYTKTVRSFVFLLLISLPALAVDIDVSFDALQKIIGNQMFTEDGRRYVKGSKTAKCNFAYLERPRITGAGEKLRVQAKFSGRSALDMFGRCVGLGDSFELTILATPYANQGTVLFKDVNVDANGRHGFYLDRVVTQLQSSFANTFKLSVDEEAKRLLDFPDAPPGALSRKVDGFKLEGIRVSRDAVVLKVDFHVTVK
jgi:hypothetical protein